MRVVVLCCEGEWQRHLVERAAHEFDLAGVVWSRAVRPKGTLIERVRRWRDPRDLLRHLYARLALRRNERRAAALHRQVREEQRNRLRDAGRARSLVTHDINSDAVARFIRECAPDLVIVNGTQLLRASVLALAPSPRLGFLNLHTGLSPYSRGGNCNLFMLLEGRPELVGVTVHHIDAGIDSGDIVLSAQVPIEAEDCWETIDARSFACGIELMIRAARLLDEGRAPRVPQWEQGKLFLRRTGYVYQPYQRVLANRLIARGAVREYLALRAQRDAPVRLVMEPQ